MNKKLKMILMTILGVVVLFKAEAFAGDQNDLFTKVLSKYVTTEGINYTDLCKDDDLNQYTEQLNNTDPKTISIEKERFAFWLNVYNAYSLQAICKKYPIKSINDLNFGGLVLSVLLKKSVWDRPFVMVNHKAHTLKEVDHEILRPTFKDPRIQFAISCGAKGCAAPRREAYEGSSVDTQLQEQTKIFINDPTLNSFDIAKKQASLSPLFNWSAKEFGRNQTEVLLFIAQYLPVQLALAIKNDPAAWKVNYKQYDLTLNDVKR